MEHDEIERFLGIFEECNLTYEQIIQEGRVNNTIEGVKMKIHRYSDDPSDPDMLNGLVLFFGWMLEDMIPNVEEWKHRATRMGMEMTQLDAPVVVYSNKEDAPPQPLLKEDDDQIFRSSCPNIDSLLESSMKEEHEAVFGEMDSLLQKVYDLNSSIGNFLDRSTCELEEEEHHAAVYFMDDSIALCVGVKNPKSFILNELPRVIPKTMLQIDKAAGEIHMATISMDWKKRKKCKMEVNFLSFDANMLRKLCSVERKVVEKRWWKKKKWKDKRRGQIMCQTTAPREIR